MPHTELDQRKRDILRAIVEDHISKGEPVGSHQIARRAEVDVSPATVRAVMADLEELGYLDKPHTSAGRVPTDRGYRFFVDSMLQVRVPSLQEREVIDRAVPGNVTVEQALEQTSRMLHDLSRHASVLLSPKPEEVVVQHVEFVRLRDDRALAVLVSKEGAVQNKLLHLDAPLSQDELTESANYLNALLASLTVEAARARIATELSDQKAIYDRLSRRALELGQSLMTEGPQSDARVLVQGQGALLESFSLDVEQAKAALRLLEEKKRILHVLDLTREAKQMQIFIGAESGFAHEGVALVASPFGEGSVLGTLGVIGPSRMNYSKVVSLVDYTARVLSRVLAS
jgi:heat-inducible transcriptional repressor